MRGREFKRAASQLPGGFVFDEQRQLAAFSSIHSDENSILTIKPFTFGTEKISQN